MLNSTSDSLFTDWPSGVGGSAREDALYPIAFGKQKGCRADIPFVSESVPLGNQLERTFLRSAVVER